MRMSLLRTLLSLLLLPPSAILAQVNSYAYGYFTGPNGQALVEVARTTNNTTKVTSVEVYYTFCTYGGGSCQQGDGVVPVSSLVGAVKTDISKPDTMKLTVDTSTLAGYHNELCTGGLGDYGDCVGSTPATGGLISITWTRTNAWATVSTSSLKSYTNGKLTGSSSNLDDVFSATQQGTVLGVNATSGAVMIASSDTASVQAQFTAKRVHTRIGVPR